MIISLKTYLSERLKKELPGKIAHSEAAPYRKINFSEKELAEARKSGVLVLFYIKEEDPHIVLIQRPKYEGTHSGQVAFPGGKQEKGDKDIIQTALREANEEVGIVIDDIEVIGQLTDVYIPVSKFNVTPVVGFVNYTPNFIIDEREVAEVVSVKLSDITKIKKLTLNEVKLNTGLKIEVPTFELNNKIVWGATAVILNELRWILRPLYKSIIS
ncbi:MAG: coenzyme A pyrophosphatase [Flavobacteriales bacterium]|nr:MAG: coenzyme A pyrophosphatase [Flavobacteriales bacterium]